MAAAGGNPSFEAVDRSTGRTGTQADFAGGHGRIDVQGDHMVDAVERAVVHHHRRTGLVLAAGGFFGRLEDEAHIALQVALREFLLEQMGHPEEHRGV